MFMKPNEAADKYHGKTVLIVEDDTFLRELYTHVLQQSGFHILTAFDGEEALKEANKSPDLILLDIMLPKLNGITVLKVLKSDSNLYKIPVVLLTNLGQDSVIKSAYQAGANGYIMKMRINPYMLIDYIKVYIKNPSYIMSYEQLDLE